MGAALRLVPDDDLTRLADQANEFHDLSRQAGQACLDFAVQAGEKLIEAKALMAHGVQPQAT